MVEIVVRHRPVCVLMFYTVVVVMSILPSGYWAAPFPVDTGRKVCGGLPTELHGGKVSLAGGAMTTEDQPRTQSISLGRYTPGQHVIVSVLESLSENDGGLRGKPSMYALQAVDGETGDPIGRFKTVTTDTRLHHCGALTILQDVQKHERNGAVFGWLPPHEGAVKDVTVYVRKLSSER